MSKSLVQTLAHIPRGHALSLATGWRNTVRDWIARSDQRRVLGELTGHFLNDIGMSPDEARREAAKPFWQR